MFFSAGPDGFFSGPVFGPSMRLTAAFLDRFFSDSVTFRSPGESSHTH